MKHYRHPGYPGENFTICGVVVDADEITPSRRRRDVCADCRTAVVVALDFVHGEAVRATDVGIVRTILLNTADTAEDAGVRGACERFAARLSSNVILEPYAQRKARNR